MISRPVFASPARAAVGPARIAHAKVRVAPHHGGGLVRRAVIDDDDLEVAVALAEHALDGVRQEVVVVVRCDDGAHERVVAHGIASHLTIVMIT